MLKSINSLFSKGYTPLVRSALVFLGVACATTVSAQSILEEVVVTAQKREQNLQDVGIAITAFTGEQMKALGIERSFDIATFSPGVHISGNLAGQNTQFSIRGVTQNDFNDIIEAPTAVYLDEGYFAIAQAQTFAVFDIERAEILKGPQGTLFGRNATGGLVQYVSRKPNFEETEGYVDFTYGLFDSDADADHFRVESAVSGPLTENVAGRVALMYNQHDGYLKNNFPNTGANTFTGGAPGPGAGADLGDDDTIGLRGTLMNEYNEDVTFTVSANYARSEIATGPYQSKSTIGIFESAPVVKPVTTAGGGPANFFNFGAGLGVGELINVIDTPANETRLSIIQGTNLDGGCDPADVGFNNLDCFATSPAGRPTPGGDFFGYVDPDGEDFTTSGDFAFEDQGETETWGINGRIEWDINDSVSFTSVTDFKDYNKLLFIDVDSAPANTTANYAGVDATSFTQELRLTGETDRSRWVAGLFYLNIDSDSDNGLKLAPGSVLSPAVTTQLFAIPSSPTLGADLGTDAQLETNSYSIFGQIEYDLTDTLMLTAGLRVMQEEKDYDMTIGVYATTSARTIHRGAFQQVFTPSPIALGVPVPGGVFTPAGGPAFAFSDSTSDTLWTGKIQLDWQANEDLLLYAGVNRGVKAGSFNAPLIGSWVGASVALGDASFIPYDEEILLSYEGGFKSTFFDGTTRFNGSIYYYDYTDYQAFLFTGIGGNVINADAENIGVEFELQTSPFEGFDAMLSMAWFDATVEDVPLRIGSTITRDVDPTYAPEFQFTALARYEWPAFSGMMNITGDISYSDEYFYNIRNFDADKFDSYVKVNLGLGWNSDDGQWNANFKVNNVTDERIGIQGFDLATACGCNEISFQPPRWYGFQVGYNF